MNLLLVLLCFSDGDARLLAQQKYLTLAEQWAPAAHALQDPVAVRRYAVLLTEYYAAQIDFRTFFVKDLHEGERLTELRRSKDAFTVNSHGQLQEQNLEGLLAAAGARFPDNPDVRFAQALYLFRGTCCLTSPRLEMKPKEALAVFQQAEASGLRSAGSMLALALEATRAGDDAAAETYIAKGLAISPQDPDLVSAHVTNLLARARYREAIAVARNLFELAYDLSLKVDALVGAARGQFALKEYTEAAETAAGALKLAPNHMFAFQVQLDCLRAAAVHAPYREAVNAFLAQNPDSLAPFQVYMDYLRLRGITEDDRLLMRAYGAVQETEPLVRITRLVNQASFLRQDRQTAQAVAFVEQAHALAGTLKDPPADLVAFLERLLAAAHASRIQP